MGWSWLLFRNEEGWDAQMIMPWCKGSLVIRINSATYVQDMCCCLAGKVQLHANWYSNCHLPDFITCANVIKEWNNLCLKKHKSIIVDELQSTRKEIKTSRSESRGQEETACVCASSGLCDYYSELFTWIASLNF